MFAAALVIPSIVLAEPAGAETLYRGKPARQWADDLASPDLRSRWYAAYVLGQIGPGASAAVPALEKVLEDRAEHEYVRGSAAWALGRIGPKAASAVPALSRSLASALVSVRRNAAAALGGMGSAARPAAAGLLKLIEDEDASVRVSAAVALWKIERSPRALAALESMLRDREGSNACRAAASLGELAADATPLVPALVATLKHADEDTRRAAAHALGRVGPAAIPAIRAVLTGGDKNAKRQAVEALGSIGPAAVPDLIETLADKHAIVRRAAARALGRLGPAAKQADAALLRAVSDPSPEVRDTAAEALREVRRAAG